MGKEDQIRKKLKQMASEVGPDVSLLALVKSVDEGEKTCVLIDDDSGMEFPEVRLRPVIDGKNSLTLIPKLDTWALAVRIEDGDDWMVIGVGEVQKVLLDCDEIIINGGSKGGLVNWPDAKAQHDLVKNFITAVKNVCSTAPIPEPGNGAASAFQAALNSALNSINAPSFENLVDNKVKH